MGKVIGNVGILDLTEATEESISGIEAVGNAGVLLYSPRTAKLMTKLNIGNIGSSGEVPDGCKLINGVLEISSSYLKSLNEPLSAYVLGQVIVKPDVEAEDLEKMIKYLGVNGQVVCPEKLLGIIQAKSNINGSIIPYTNDYFINTGKFNIDSQFLKSVESPVTLALIGKVSMLEGIDESLFSEKIERIFVAGKVLIREEYLEMFNKKMGSRQSCKVEVIPEGYSYIDNDLTLDSISIKRFDSAKLFITGMLLINDDVTPEVLKQHISMIQTKDIIVCRKELKEALYELSADSAPQVCDYSGKVRIIDGEHMLTQTELKYSPANITYIVRGDLTINKDLQPDTFIEKVEHIDNFGDITCNMEQYGLIQLKLRASSGDITTGEDRETSESGGIGNVGFLKL